MSDPVGLVLASARHAPSRSSGVAPFRHVVLVTLAAGLGYGFDAYAVNLFGMLGPTLMGALHISVRTFGLIGSFFLVGYTLGTIGFGALADRVGRRDVLGLSIVLFGLTTALGGLTTSPVLFAFLRFLTGIGGAGELAVGAPYAVEMWPRRWRALGAGGVVFSFYSAGYVMAALAALLIVPRFGWRWTFILAVVPALLIFLVRRQVPESVRFNEVRYASEPRISLWSVPGAWRRIVAGWLLYVPNACGYWGITVFLTIFMVRKFHVTSDEAIFYALMFYVVQFVLCYVGTGLSDLIGRRPAGIIGAVAMIGCTVAASLATTLQEFLVFGGAMIGLLGWLWGIGDAYLSEFFRTSLRGTAFGLMVGGGRIVSIGAPALVGAGIAAYGPTIPFLATSLLWLLTIAGYLLGPETAGRELEEVQL